MRGYMYMKKVLIVSTIPAYPIDSGKKVVLNGIVNYFLDTYGAENVDYIVLDYLDEENVSPVNTISLKQPKSLVKVKNVLWHTFIRKTKSIQESVIYSQENTKYIERRIKEINYDLVLFDTVRIAQFFEDNEKIKSKSVVYLDDLFSIRYEKMLETYQKYPGISLNAIGNFGRFLPGPLVNILKLSLIEKSFLRFERSLIAKREIEISRKYNHNLLINRHEVSVLNKKLSKNSVQEIKPLVKIKNTCDRNFQSQPTFVFLGALNVPHNNFSITQFIKNQMDALIQVIPNVKLLIIGKNPSDVLKELVAKYPHNIEMKGFVEDIDSIFSECCAMIVPLLFGSGVKLKTLEAFGRGLPVVGTDFAFEGINITNYQQCILENNMNNYPKLMKELIDKETNDSISKNSKEFFESFYSKNAIYGHYREIFS